jgi:hypothetical protein
VFRAIELFGDQLAIPAENSIGFGEARHLLQPFTPQTLADFRQRGPLAVRQPANSTANVPSKYGSRPRQILILQLVPE